ncbi:MAG: thiolase domain-containing protein [Deltaproteobacteria bacterium]|nr:thiolase domain-containing protein [Deltaproteobacteria bacterium]MBW2120234.1 thiolase domain-containing protein [Deltaproteobacteria bacterium]
MKDVAIIGVGQSKFSRRCGMPITELCFEAFREAMQGLALDKKEIDASICCSSMYDKQRTPENPISEYLGLTPKPTFLIENACAAGTTGLRVAWSFIMSGLYKVVAVVGVEKMSGLNSREVAELMGRSYDITWESSFGLTMAAGYALHAQAHMERYGTTLEQLAGVRVKNSHYSVANPKATYRKALELDEVMASTPVASPLRMLDCCANADGASCVILAHRDVAGRVCPKPVWILGLGAASNTGLSRRESFTGLSCSRQAAQQAYQMAGLGPADINLAEVHDCFTIAEIMAYEDLGFVGPGQGGFLIDEKQTYLEGRIPVNVDGGLLCKGHPVGATGGSQIRTIVQQLRGEAGEVQVKNAEIGLVHNVGGIGHFANVTILGR